MMIEWKKSYPGVWKGVAGSPELTLTGFSGKSVFYIRTAHRKEDKPLIVEHDRATARRIIAGASCMRNILNGVRYEKLENRV